MSWMDERLQAGQEWWLSGFYSRTVEKDKHKCSKDLQNLTVSMCPGLNATFPKVKGNIILDSSQLLKKTLNAEAI